MITITIVIPIYNVRDYIKNCIDSILNQTYKDYEVILVDDCGRDDSVAIAEKMLEGKIKYSTLRHDHNRGLSAARNTGVAEAKGEYILFVDSDDSLTHDCLEKLVRMADKTKADITVGNINVIGNGTNIPLLSDKLPDIFTSRDEILESYIYFLIYVLIEEKLLYNVGSFLSQPS